MIRTDPFDIARAACEKSDGIVTRYKHSAVILDKKFRVIAVGRNHWSGKTIESDDGHPIDKTIHAEIDGLRKVNIRRLHGATLISYSMTRVATNMARPCINCYAVLKKLGFSKIYYSVRSSLEVPIWIEESLR